MKVLLDTNIIVDVIERREPHFIASSEVWSAVEEKRVQGAVTSLTVITVHYLAKRKVGHAATMRGITQIQKTLEIIDVGSEDINHGMDAITTDFEDAVQAFAAARAGVVWIVTRDRKGFSRSPVPSILPTELLALLRTQGST